LSEVRILKDTSVKESPRYLSRLALRLFGRPISTDAETTQRIGPAAGIPVFGLDALGSTAYGPEAALTVLLPLGLAGQKHILPITVCIAGLLVLVYISYRQTIAAYPTGAGSYTVARRNLGPRLGLAAGAALMLDYVLNAAVGISSGVGALISAVPSWQPYTLTLCLITLTLITFVNLRGLRETGLVLMAPTYIFLGCLFTALGIGVVKTIVSGGNPQPIVSPPPLQETAAGASVWLAIRAFSSGCTALTGVEAVSNGVQAFREPVVRTAQITLTMIVATLVLLLLGVAFVAHAYHIGATEPGRPGYESVLSQILAAVSGHGALYYAGIASILAVLAMSANTSFADFPRLCRAIAHDSYLPYGFTARGQRLVYSYGVYVLAALTAVLLIAFGGVTDRLIPLFAIGAFLSFTFSQAGMVAHWRKQGGNQARRRGAVNLLGAVATGGTLVVITIAKFREGAWATAILIPALMLLMEGIRRHYHHVAKEVSSVSALHLENLDPPLIVVPIDEWDNIAKKALHFAMKLSDDVQVLHIDSGEQNGSLQKHWDEWVVQPAIERQRKAPELVIVKSPYRYIAGPIVNYVWELEQANPGRQVAIVLSNLVERRWYQIPLHNQRAKTLTTLLLTNGNRRVTVINVPWYLSG
jgi:amino acid transporter